MDREINREKVIKGLECIVSSGNAGMKDDCASCIYPGGGDCIAPALRDALALLKAQEAREPHYTKLEYIVNGMPVAINHPECPRCYDNGLVLWDAEIVKGAAYCKRCGQAVKWE